MNLICNKKNRISAIFFPSLHQLCSYAAIVLRNSFDIFRISASRSNFVNSIHFFSRCLPTIKFPTFSTKAILILCGKEQTTIQFSNHTLLLVLVGGTYSSFDFLRLSLRIIRAAANAISLDCFRFHFFVFIFESILSMSTAAELKMSMAIER